MKTSRIAFVAAALLALGSFSALAGNTTLVSPRTGDVTFPFSPPPLAGTAGSIDNMSIGATTPRPAAVTTLSASGAVTGAGFSSRFAAPGPIGSVTPSTGAFTTLGSTGLASAASLQIDTGTKTATATAGAATLNKNAGVVTSEALTTAAGATYTLTITDSAIAAADQVMASVQLGTATTGMPTVTTVTPGAGSLVVVVQNIHASVALNGTIKIAFVVAKN